LGIINFVDGFINNTLHKGHAPGEFQMMTRKAFDRVGGFNEKLIVAEDVEMFEKLSRIGKTLFESSLTVFQTGRRVHQVGWFRVLLSWAINAISNSFLKKSFSKEWKEIR